MKEQLCKYIYDVMVEKDFTSQDGYLIVDVDIECRTADHNVATGLAWLAVVIYPIGLMVFNGVLLYLARKAITSGKETPLSRSIAFLYKEFDVTCFWWELAEMLRRFLLVGLFVVIEPHTMMQLALGTIVSAVFLLVQLQAKPYKDELDDYFANASNFSLLMIFIC